MLIVDIYFMIDFVFKWSDFFGTAITAAPPIKRRQPV